MPLMERLILTFSEIFDLKNIQQFHLVVEKPTGILIFSWHLGLLQVAVFQLPYAAQILPSIPSSWSFPPKKERAVRQNGGCHYTSFVIQH